MVIRMVVNPFTFYGRILCGNEHGDNSNGNKGIEYKVPSFLFSKRLNPCPSMFETSNSVIFGDMYKTYDKAIIKF